jgi:hypothetical protein
VANISFWISLNRLVGGGLAVVAGDGDLDAVGNQLPRSCAMRADDRAVMSAALAAGLLGDRRWSPPAHAASRAGAPGGAPCQT